MFKNHTWVCWLDVYKLLAIYFTYIACTHLLTLPLLIANVLAGNIAEPPTLFASVLASKCKFETIPTLQLFAL